MGFDAVHVGIDVGKMSDSTAIVACQVITEVPLPTRYVTQHLERVPLGTSYPDIAAHCVKVLAAIQTLLNTQSASRIAALAEQVKATGQQVSYGRSGIPRVEIRVFVDVTGVGRPVFDMIERVVQTDPRIRSLDLRPITFAHGETYNAKTGRMGKAYMVSRLQTLLQSRLVQLPPRHPEAQAMARELKDLRSVLMRMRRIPTARFRPARMMTS